ncbi:hypothetical protein CJF26_12035 [Photobacterium phosphoreum]|nr:hypothetical protein [Photobacterium phosphoreum]
MRTDIFLADFVDLTGHRLKGKECHGLGRNCELFENVAHWAYREVRPQQPYCLLIMRVSGKKPY